MQSGHGISVTGEGLCFDCYGKHWHHFSLFSEKEKAQKRTQRHNSLGGQSIVLNGLLNEGEGEKLTTLSLDRTTTPLPSTMAQNIPTGACFIYEPKEDGEWKVMEKPESRKQFLWMELVNEKIKTLERD